MAGIFFNITNKQLTLAATDSYRLSEVSEKITVEEEINCVVPARTINEVQRLIGIEEVSSVEMKISESEASFRIGESELISQLIDGKYPDYVKIIPESSQTTLVCDTDKLLEAVKVSTVFARENSHSINLKSENNQLTILAQTNEIGENIINIPINQKGKDTEIAINAKYLSDILNIINSNQVSIELNSKLDPLLIKPVNNSKEIYIIMPLRS